MTTRGIRNNNPGNIRKGRTKWQGLAKEQPDSAFCTFTSMPYGIRALIKTLMTYHNKHKLNTVKKIINRWAPPVENNTTAYIQSVCKQMPIPLEPDDIIPLADIPQLYVALAKAIARHENGKAALNIPTEDWKKGAILAGL